MKKRFFCLGLALTLTLSLLPGAALAAGFSDVPADSWYAQAVAYVSEEGLMNGTDSTHFSPNNGVTRGMLVTVLYRLAGSPSASASNRFTDVSSDAWYAKAVAWAAAQGIVNGTSTTTFSPAEKVTREQFAVILYRYGADKGWAADTLADLSGYRDVADLSDYAADGMAWACGQGLITGTSATALSPKAGATRAQTAVILTRFCQIAAADDEDEGDTPVSLPSSAQMVANLKASSLGKTDTLAAMAEVLLDDGFAPAFVAGILGNILAEGACGLFESSAYLTNPDAEPDYLVYLDENYDYRTLYSGQLIYSGIRLSDVQALLEALGSGGSDGKGTCFGLGCMQWTSYSRISRLVSYYQEEAGEADTITLAQTQRAEGRLISYELQNGYQAVYSSWQSANEVQNTENAAYDAGVRVCTGYGIPAGYQTASLQAARGDNGAKVFRVMAGID